MDRTDSPPILYSPTSWHNHPVEMTDGYGNFSILFSDKSFVDYLENGRSRLVNTDHSSIISLVKDVRA